MKEIKWRRFDESPTVSDPEKKVFAEEAKELYLTLLHQKLKERVVSGEISQAEMDRKLIKLGVNLPTHHLFPTEDLKKYGIDKVTITRGNVELCADIMANARETNPDSDKEDSKKVILN